MFDAQNFKHIFLCQRFKIEPVGGVIISRDGLGVAVDHDRFDADIAQRKRRVATAIVKLDALADAVWPATQNHHFAPAAGRCLALWRLAKRGLVSRIHIGGGRGEFGSAGVDALINRVQAQGGAPGANRCLVGSGEQRQAGVGKAHCLDLAEIVDVIGQTMGAHPVFDVDNFLNPVDIPRVDAAKGKNFIVGKAPAQRLGQHQNAVRGCGAKGGAHRIDVVAVLGAGDLDLVKAGEANFKRAQCFLHRFGKGTPD